MDDLVRESDQLPVRVIGRPFQPGTSGNPAGRRESDYTMAVRTVRTKNIARCQQLLDKLYTQGINGDSKSAEIYLRFVLAAPKPIEAATPLEFDGTSTVGLLQALFGAMAQGRIGFEAAAKLLASLGPHLEAPLLELKREVEAACAK